MAGDGLRFLGFKRRMSHGIRLLCGRGRFAAGLVAIFGRPVTERRQPIGFPLHPRRRLLVTEMYKDGDRPWPRSPRRSPPP